MEGVDHPCNASFRPVRLASCHSLSTIHIRVASVISFIPVDLSTMPVTLDHDCFPHIVEAILFYADRKTLLDARLLSSSMRRIADSFFCGDGMSIVFSKAKTGSSSQESESFTRTVTSVGSSLEAITRGSRRLRVPCFHPAGDLEAQHRAISRASRLTLLCCAVTPPLNDLLQHIQPTCELNLYHSDGYATSSTPLCIPPTSSIEIDLSTFCCGFDTSG